MNLEVHDHAPHFFKGQGSTKDTKITSDEKGTQFITNEP